MMIRSFPSESDLFGIILRFRSVYQQGTRLTPKPDEGIDPVFWIQRPAHFLPVASIEGQK